MVPTKRVRKRRKRSLRYRIRKAFQKFWKALRRGPFAAAHPATKKRPSKSRTSKSRRLKKSRVKVRKEAPDLVFNQDSPWGWSLKIYQERRLLGIMQASTPVSCLEVVRPYFSGRREPLPEYRILIRCNANGRKLKIDRATFDRLPKAETDHEGADLLRHLGEHFDRNLSKIADSSSVTVMVDDHNEVIDSTSLLKQVFGRETT